MEENNPRYVIVDQETGEVVGELAQTERRNTLKAILSWIVLWCCSAIFGSLSCLAFGFPIRVERDIQGLPPYLYVSICVIGGVLTLCTIAAVLIFGGKLCVTASEATCKTRKGARYIVIGIFHLLLGGIELTSAIYRLSMGYQNSDMSLAICLGWVMFYIAIMVIGIRYRKASFRFWRKDREK